MLTIFFLAGDDADFLLGGTDLKIMIAVLVIYLLASLGFLLAHCGVITGGSPRFTGLLPCVIVALLTGCSDHLGHQTDQQLVGVAERAMNAEKYGQALEAMNVLVERNPRNFNYLSGRAMILSLSGRVEAAPADFDRCIALDAKQGRQVRFVVADRLVRTGRHLAATKQFEKALVMLDTAVRLFPKAGNAYHDRGAVKMALGDYQGALKDFTLAIEHDQGNNRFGDSLLLRSRAKEKLGDNEGAKQDQALSEKQAEQNQ